MKTVHETARLTGVSVRTLHYYDEIGLLRPDETTGAGYRLYGEGALARLQQILFFRELGFPLREIAEIMSSEQYDPRRALERQRGLLTLRRDRLDRLIGLTDRILKGEQTMSFQEFDLSEIEAARRQYAAEAKERWGGTEAWRESERRSATYGREDWLTIQAESERIFFAFAALRGEAPSSPEAQEMVNAWQDHISRYFYPCSDEILSGLGEMYVQDERFTQNIDRFGPGTARFLRDAIRARRDR